MSVDQIRSFWQNPDLIEDLVSQFYTSENANARQSSQSTLDALKSFKDAFHYAPSLMDEFRNHYSVYFGILVFQELITKQWEAIDHETKIQVREFLINRLVKPKTTTLPSFCTNTLIKTIVEIAKRDHTTWTSFFDDVLALESTLALLVLKISCEEFVSTKENIPAHLKMSAQVFLERNLPNIFDFCLLFLSSSLVVDASTPITPISSPLTVDSLPDSIRTNTHQCALALEICHSLFGWLPFHLVTPHFIDTLLQLSSPHNYVSILSLGCLNELLSRKYLPPDASNQFLLMVLKQSTKNFQILTESPPYSEDYASKLIDFLSFFLGQHMHRLDNLGQDQMVLELLQRFYTFSFSLNEPELFGASIAVWTSVVEFCHSSAPVMVQKYAEALTAICGALLKRLQFTQSQALLCSLDDDDVVEDIELPGIEMTEFQKHQSLCLEFLAKVSEFYPNLVVTELFELLVQHGDNLGNGNLLVARDLAMVLDGLGRIHTVFLTRFDENFVGVWEILRRMSNVLSFSVERTLWNAGRYFEDLIVGTLSTFNLFIHWLNLASSQGSNEFKAEYERYMTTVIECVLECAVSSRPKISIAASRLLLSATTTLKIPMNNFPAFHAILRNFRHTSMQRDAESRRFITMTLTRSIILAPIPPEQKRSLLIDMTQVSNDHQVIKHSLTVASAMIQSISTENTASKDIVFEAIKPYVDSSMNLLDGLSAAQIDFDMFNAVLEFLGQICDSLRKQIDVAVLGPIIKRFMKGIENELERFSSQDEGVEVIRRFILIITSLVGDNSKTFSAFVPECIGFIITHLQPRLLNSDKKILEPILIPSYTLIRTILETHWRHFFPTGQIQMSAASLGGFGQLLANKNAEQFQALNLIILKSFEKHAALPAVWKNNLEILEMLQKTKKMFHKDEFKPIHSMLLTLFLRILLSKTHDFLREELINIVWSLISVDVPGFHEYFVPSFLNNQCSQLGQVQRTDCERYLRDVRDAESCVGKLGSLVNEFDALSGGGVVGTA